MVLCKWSLWSFWTCVVHLANSGLLSLLKIYDNEVLNGGNQIISTVLGGDYGKKILHHTLPFWQPLKNIQISFIDIVVLLLNVWHFGTLWFCPSWCENVYTVVAVRHFLNLAQVGWIKVVRYMLVPVDHTVCRHIAITAYDKLNTPAFANITHHSTNGMLSWKAFCSSALGRWSPL